LFDASAEPKGGHGYQVKWDSGLKRMIAYRDISDLSLPAIRVLSNSGNNIPLYPLKDFPGSSYIDIWDVTGAPNGDIVVAAVLGYGPRNVNPVPVKSVVLTYDETGVLRRVWDVGPYHHHRVAADPAGNVFALGDGGKGTGDYPLLIKYSFSGDVVRELLPSSLFSDKDSVIDLKSPDGEPQLFIRNSHLYVWIAHTRELFTFSLDGTLISSNSLSGAAQGIADLGGSSNVRFLGLDVDSNERIVAQVQLWPKDRKLPLTVGLAHLKQNGSFDSWLEPASRGDAHRFLGLTTDDKRVFLEKVGQRAVSINLSN